MRTFTSKASGIALVATAAVLAACSGGSDGGGAQTGTLKVGITDAPVDFADEAVIEFTGVELKPRGGAAFSIDFAPRRLDLLELQGTNRALLLDGETVAAGDYEWMRLKVTADPNVGGDSYLRLAEGGEECELRIPSGDETGLKLVRGFTVGVGSITDLTIDFDLRKSVVAPPGQKTPSTTCGGQAFLLKPALRIVDNLKVGAIGGSVDSNLVTASCPAQNGAPYPGNVYLFGPVPADAQAVPDDYDGVEADPNGADAVASARVDPNSFSYAIGFVPVGNYVVAYTCDLDDATVDASPSTMQPTPVESVKFWPAGGLPVTVTAGQMVTQDFGPPGM
jgi:hypothetical protein